MSKITTHVLDTSIGKPASNIAVALTDFESAHPFAQGLDPAPAFVASLPLAPPFPAPPFLLLLIRLTPRAGPPGIDAPR